MLGKETGSSEKENEGASDSHEAKLWENERKVIRSLLISHKHGATMMMLQKDYIDIVGSAPQFKKFGFSSATEMLEAMPDVVRCSRTRDGKMVYFAIPSEATKGIASLVKAQKTAKPKPLRSYVLTSSKVVKSNMYSPRGDSFRRSTPFFSQSATRSYHTNNPRNNARPTRNWNDDRFNGAAPRPQKQLAAKQSIPAGGRRPSQQPSSNIDTSIIQKVEELSNRLKLGKPKYEFACRTTSGGGHLCSATVYGIHTASREYNTQTEAQVEAANELHEKLSQYHPVKLAADSGKTASGAEGASLNADEQTETVIDNLLTLLTKYGRGGIYSHFLVQEYMQTFKEPLPADWLKRVSEDCVPEITVENIDFNRVIVKKATTPHPLASTTAPAFVAAPPVRHVVEPSALPTPKKEPPRSVQFSEGHDECLFEREPGEDEEIIVAEGLPTMTLPKNDEWMVFVTVVQSPADFTILLVDEQPRLQQLQKDMYNFYETEGKGQRIDNNLDSSLAIDLYNRLVAVRSEDSWHRAYVTEVIAADEGLGEGAAAAVVYYVDHGDVETVPLEDLRDLEPQFLKLPRQAIQASLCGFQDFQTEDFPISVLEYFQSSTVSRVLLAHRVASQMKDDDENESDQPVVLYLYNPEDPLVHEADDEAGQCVDSPSSSPIAGCYNVLLTNMMAAEATDTPGASLDIDDSYMVGADGQVVEEAMTDSGNAHMASPQTPAVDDKVEMRVLENFDDPTLLQVLALMSPDPSEMIVRPLVMENELKLLQAEMNSTYGSSSYTGEESPSCYYAVNYNDIWQRAYCATTAGNAKTVTVYLVDSGVIRSVDRQRLRTLQPRFSRLPILAFCCSLASIQPIRSSTWSEAAATAFDQRTTNKSLEIKVQSVTVCQRYGKPALPLIRADDLVDLETSESLKQFMLLKKLAILA